MKNRPIQVRLALLVISLTAAAGFAATRHRDDAFLPAYRPSDVLVEHLGYTLCYSEKDEQAAWIAYELTARETQARLPRSDNFREDPSVPTESASPSDYKGSGYDRGHLAPAADMEWSKEVMSESFLMSNMSPQKPALNRGKWKDLEEQVRGWAVRDSALYVITGPVLTQKPIGAIGKNKVTVPASYFKVIVDMTEPEIKGIGFLMPNAALKEPISAYAASINEVEKVTGLNFFPNLSVQTEIAVEGSTDLAVWDWPGDRVAASTARQRRTASRESVQQKVPGPIPRSSGVDWYGIPIWVSLLIGIVVLLTVYNRFR